MAKAIKKYEQEKVERIMFRVPKGEKARIQAHAASRGESTNAFIYAPSMRPFSGKEKRGRTMIDREQEKGFF